MPAQADPGNSDTAASVATRSKWANIGTGKCLDVRAGSFSDFAVIQQFSCKDELHQKFWTDPLVGEPYTFINPGHATLMCVQPTTLDSSGLIVQRSCTHTDGQKWEFIWQNGGALIKSKVSGLCLADAGMPNGSRREVRQLPCTGEAGQLWLNRA
ncbi:RICIN domain-containing protein [Streptomyces sp. NPDC127110]|uniref:RICIN domain-containing protein n=1 Tax=Streptomyces sp. NPDC127110 TaxID=3345362 RepID=UPI003630DA0E